MAVCMLLDPSRVTLVSIEAGGVLDVISVGPIRGLSLVTKRRILSPSLPCSRLPLEIIIDGDHMCTYGSTNTGVGIGIGTSGEVSSFGYWSSAVKSKSRKNLF